MAGGQLRMACFIWMVLVFLCDATSLTWYRDASFDNKLEHSLHGMTSKWAESDVQCARRCQGEPYCNSFFYNIVSRSCLPQWMVFVSTFEAFAETGWRYYRVAPASCPADEDYIVDRQTSTCYRPKATSSEKRVTWEQARDACFSRGDTLVSLEPVYKAHFLKDFMDVNEDIPRTNYLIGAHRPYSVWNTAWPASGPDFLWLSGPQVNMTLTARYWGPGNPDNNDDDDNIVFMDDDQHWGWEDGPSTSTANYICERSLHV